MVYKYFRFLYIVKYAIKWELWGSNPRGYHPLGLKSNALTTRPNSLFLYYILVRVLCLCLCLCPVPVPVPVPVPCAPHTSLNHLRPARCVLLVASSLPSSSCSLPLPSNSFYSSSFPKNPIKIKKKIYIQK